MPGRHPPMRGGDLRRSGTCPMEAPENQRLSGPESVLQGLLGSSSPASFRHAFSQKIKKLAFLKEKLGAGPIQGIPGPAGISFDRDRPKLTDLSAQRDLIQLVSDRTD